VVYLFCFGTGLYLFGPAHGYQKITAFKIRTSSESKADSIQALKKELALLKRDFKKIEAANKQQNFNPADFVLPVSGELTNRFHWVNSAGAWKLHSGVDIAVESGSNITTAAPGKIVLLRTDDDGTYTVRVDHGNGWESLYAGLSEVKVGEGTTVIPGVVLGKSGYSVCGSEEPGFHFSIYHDGQPVDPRKIIRGLMAE
jgi:murein DD-endopeptidase MepM/ murein hydrolase activator NlpD